MKLTNVNRTFEYTDEIARKMIDDLHALMWHSGDGCEICKFKVVNERKPYRSLSCSLKECEPVYEGLSIVEETIEEEQI